jgi:hypothetical protein
MNNRPMAAEEVIRQRDQGGWKEKEVPHIAPLTPEALALAKSAFVGASTPQTSLEPQGPPEPNSKAGQPLQLLHPHGAVKVVHVGPREVHMG